MIGREDALGGCMWLICMGRLPSSPASPVAISYAPRSKIVDEGRDLARAAGAAHFTVAAIVDLEVGAATSYLTEPAAAGPRYA